MTAKKCYWYSCYNALVVFSHHNIHSGFFTCISYIVGFKTHHKTLIYLRPMLNCKPFLLQIDVFFGRHLGAYYSLKIMIISTDVSSKIIQVISSQCTIRSLKIKIKQI